MRAIVIHAAKDLRIEERARSRRPVPARSASRLAAGGICGSDLHYYSHGGFGAVRLSEPMILGHEVSGHVAELGAGVEGLASWRSRRGLAVAALRPLPVLRRGAAQPVPEHALLRRGDALSPHPGRLSRGTGRRRDAMREGRGPDAGRGGDGRAASAVTLHATRRAGEMLGKRVLVTGCGPIGVLAILAARRAGAAEIVATDLSDFTLSLCPQGRRRPDDQHGQRDPTRWRPMRRTRARSMCSTNAPAPRRRSAAGIAAMRPRGVMMQLGLGGDMTIPMMAMTAKELDLRGSFRFHEEFATGVGLMQKGLVDVKPLISHTLPLDRRPLRRSNWRATGAGDEDADRLRLSSNSCHGR